MKRHQHLFAGAIALLVAVALLRFGGTNPLTAGIGFAFLLGPIVMGTVIWLLMRQPSTTNSTRENSETHKIHKVPEQPATGAHP